MAFDQTEKREGQHRHANFGCQQNPTEGLQKRLVGGGSRLEAACLAGGYGNDECRKEPIADHHDHHDIVFTRQMAADPVLNGKDDGRGNHQENALAGVLLDQFLRPFVIWRLRPNPCALVIENPAHSRARRTAPAAV